MANSDVTGADYPIAVYFENVNNADIVNLKNELIASKVSDSATSFTGTYLNDDVTADVGTTKNLNINLGAGFNSADTTNASGKNTITAAANSSNTVLVGKGDDVLTLNSGNNVITYDLSSGKTIGNDVINLTRGEDLQINMQEAKEGQISKEIVGNDLVITAKKVVGSEYHYGYTETVNSDVDR